MRFGLHVLQIFFKTACRGVTADGFTPLQQMRPYSVTKGYPVEYRCAVALGIQWNARSGNKTGSLSCLLSYRRIVSYKWPALRRYRVSTFAGLFTFSVRLRKLFQKSIFGFKHKWWRTAAFIFNLSILIHEVFHFFLLSSLPQKRFHWLDDVDWVEF